MKKRKFNILLNIAVLCMCVCAIAIGVYSAKTASLNVSGTIGFQAHNCKVRVLGKITGAVDASNNAITSNTSTATINYTDSSNTSQGKLIDGTADIWSFGSIFFDDLNSTEDEIATDIIFTFTITNESSYEILASMSGPTLPNGVDYGIASTGDYSSGAYAIIPKDGSVTFTLTMRVVEGTTITTTNIQNLSFSFEKTPTTSTVADNLVFTTNDTTRNATANFNLSSWDGSSSYDEINIPAIYVADSGKTYLVDKMGNDFKGISITKITMPRSLISTGSLMGTGIQSVVLPKSIKTISIMPNSITEITIPIGVTTIGGTAFANCTNLTSVKIPSGCTTIGNYAFNGCTNLTNITIPNSITTISNSAFNNCTNLQYNIYDNGKYLGNSINKYVVLMGLSDKNATSCDIYDGCRVIMNSGDFTSDSKVESVKIPGSVKIIPASSFFYTPFLKNVTLCEGIEEIGASAFEDCDAITEIVLPSTIKKVGSSAFRQRMSVMTMFTINSTDAEIDKDVFYGTKPATIKIVTGNTKTYDFITNYYTLSKTENGYKIYTVNDGVNN